MNIDLRSDTITKPTQAMRDAMFSAELGDDVFAEDPTVNLLQEKLAAMFGKESGLFVPSGTMSNQIAINVHTRPGDEVICSQLAHVYLYEGGGIAKNSGASVRLLDGDRGMITAKEVQAGINGADSHLARTSLVCVEDTCNKGGGAIYDFAELEKIAEVCKNKQLKFHCDGARLFNALVETKTETKKYGSLFDSISICLSKGLGTPVGSVLLGSASFIREAHRMRKVFGGGMRQVGLLAAAGIYALNHHLPLLKEDHRRAKLIGEKLQTCAYVKNVMPVETNIVIFELADGITSIEQVKTFAEKGIMCFAFGPTKIRFVTHLDFDDNQLNELLEKL